MTTELPVNSVREKTQAKYQFTTEEIAELGKNLQGARRDQKQLEEELDSIKATYKSKLGATEIEQNTFGRKLDDGYEMREAFAVVTFNDPIKGRKTYRHEETSETIKEEPMTHLDWQLPMFTDENGRDATEPLPVIPADGFSNADVVIETAVEREKNKEGAEFLSTEGEGTKEDLGRVLDVPGAGTTPLGEAIHKAVAAKDLPRVRVKLDSNCTATKVRMQFRKAANNAGWPAAAIDLLEEKAREMDENIASVMALYSAHIETTPVTPEEK